MTTVMEVMDYFDNHNRNDDGNTNNDDNNNNNNGIGINNRTKDNSNNHNDDTNPLNLLSFNPQPPPPTKRRKVTGGSGGGGTSTFRSGVRGIVTRRNLKGGDEGVEEREIGQESGARQVVQSRLHDYFGRGGEGGGGGGGGGESVVEGVQDEISRLVDGIVEEDRDGHEEEEGNDEVGGHEVGNVRSSSVSSGLGLGWKDIPDVDGGGEVKRKKVKNKRQREELGSVAEMEGGREAGLGGDGGRDGSEQTNLSKPKKRRRKDQTPVISKLPLPVPIHSSQLPPSPSLPPPPPPLAKKKHWASLGFSNDIEPAVAQLATPESCPDDDHGLAEPLVDSQYEQSRQGDSDSDRDSDNSSVTPRGLRRVSSTVTRPHNISTSMPMGPTSRSPTAQSASTSLVDTSSDSYSDSDSGSMVTSDSDDDEAEEEEEEEMEYPITSASFDAYTQMLNDAIRSASTRDLSPLGEKFPPLTSSNVLGSVWTAGEKDRFFNALGRFGRHDLPALSAHVRTKSPVECRAYVKALQEGLEDVKNSPELAEVLVNYEDIPAAVELSEKLVEYLDRHAEALEDETNIDDALEEEAIHGKEMWVVNENLARKIDAYWTKGGGRESTDSVNTTSTAFAPPKETELLRTSTFLRLSSRFFMNKRVSRECPERLTPPEIRMTCLLDFHTLSKTLTERLIQSAIFMAQSRIRTTTGMVGVQTNPCVHEADVRAATDLLGLSDPVLPQGEKSIGTTGKDFSGRRKAFWVGMARRNGLRVAKGYGYKIMSHRALEKVLKERRRQVVVGKVKGERKPRNWKKGGLVKEGVGADKVDKSNENNDDDDGNATGQSGMEESDEEESGSEVSSTSESSDVELSEDESDAFSDTSSSSSESTTLDAYANYIDILASHASEKEIWKTLLPGDISPPASPSPPSSRSPSPLPLPDLLDEVPMEGCWEEEFPYYTSWTKLKSVVYEPERESSDDDDENEETDGSSDGDVVRTTPRPQFVPPKPKRPAKRRNEEKEEARKRVKVGKKIAAAKISKVITGNKRSNMATDDSQTSSGSGSSESESEEDTPHPGPSRIYDLGFSQPTAAPVPAPPPPSTKTRTLTATFQFKTSNSKPSNAPKSPLKSRSKTPSTPKPKPRQTPKQKTPQASRRRRSSTSSPSPEPARSAEQDVEVEDRWDSDRAKDEDEDLDDLDDAAFDARNQGAVRQPSVLRPARARAPVQRLGTLVSTVEAVAALEEEGMGGDG